MAIALRTPKFDKRFLGDLASGEVHTKGSASLGCCRPAELVEAGTAVIFNPDTILRAELEGFVRCPWCLGPDPAHDEDL